MYFKAKELLLAVSVLGVIVASQSSFAGSSVYDADCRYNGRTISLDYNNEKFKETTYFNLKDIILRNCRGLRSLRLLRLESVTLVAKAKDDYGTAELQVGRYSNGRRRLNDDYRAVTLMAPRVQPINSTWRLIIVGKTKFNTLTLRVSRVLRRPLPGPGPIVRVPQRGPRVVVHHRPHYRPGRIVRRTHRAVRRAVRRVHRVIHRRHRRAVRKHRRDHRNHRRSHRRAHRRGHRR